MKKAYVKPVMESEAFVANEYVAACWTVTCTECGAVEEGYENLKKGVQTQSTVFGTESIYPGKLGGMDTCESYDIPRTQPSIRVDFWGWLAWEIFVDGLKWVKPGVEATVSYHHAEVASGWTKTNHPYASV